MSNQNSSIQQLSSSAMNTPGPGVDLSFGVSSQILGTTTASTSSSQFLAVLDKNEAKLMASARD